MGLDMYLKKKIFIGAEFEQRKVTGKIEIKIKDSLVEIDLSKVSEIVCAVAYWRKANQIHKWFVDNAQDGKDECQESYVSYDQLVELRETCKLVLKGKNPELLPPEEGFFFGSTEVDQWYWEDIEHTIKQLSNIKEKEDYYYRASW